MSVLHGLRVRCEAAPIFAQATGEEWAALVLAEGHRYRYLSGVMDEGMEYGGCWVLPPWVRMPKLRVNRRDPQVSDPEAFADALLRHQGYEDLALDKYAEHQRPKEGHRLPGRWR